VSPARENTFDTSATLALAVQAMQINTKAKVITIIIIIIIINKIIINKIIINKIIITLQNA